jgi:hypothetical protein
MPDLGNVTNVGRLCILKKGHPLLGCPLLGLLLCDNVVFMITEENASLVQLVGDLMGWQHINHVVML